MKNSPTEKYTRGEVYWVRFEPAEGGEIKKTRPAVILSPTLHNEHKNRVIVVPLSTKTEKLFPTDALLRFRDLPHKAMTDQVRTISTTRILEKLGNVSAQDLLKIERKLQVALGIKKRHRRK